MKELTEELISQHASIVEAMELSDCFGVEDSVRREEIEIELHKRGIDIDALEIWNRID